MISLAAGTVLDATPTEVLRAAASAGYDAVGLRLDPLATSVAEAAALRRQAEDSGLVLLDLEVVRLRPDRSMDQHRRMLDLAEGLGARFLLTVSEHQDDTITTDELAQLWQLSTQYPTRIALEFMRFTGVRTLDAALTLLDRAGADDAVVLVDALHLQRSGHQPEEVSAVAPHRLGYVQLCDAPRLGPTDDAALSWEARHDRLAPGEGDLPLLALLSALPADVPLSVEVQSDHLAAQWDPRTRAAHLRESTRALLATSDTARTTEKETA